MPACSCAQWAKRRLWIVLRDHTGDINVIALMFSVITFILVRMFDGLIRAFNGNWRPSSVGGGDSFVHIENLGQKLRPMKTPFLWSLQMWLSAETKPTPPWSLRTLDNLECFSVHWTGNCRNAGHAVGRPWNVDKIAKYVSCKLLGSRQRTRLVGYIYWKYSIRRQYSNYQSRC